MEKIEILRESPPIPAMEIFAMLPAIRAFMRSDPELPLEPPPQPKKPESVEELSTLTVLVCQECFKAINEAISSGKGITRGFYPPPL